MGFWKTLCTCVGCAAGLACIALTGGAATPLVTAAAIGIGGVAGHLTGHKIEQEEKKNKNQAKDLELKQQTIKGLTKNNEKFQKQEAEQNNKLKELERRIEDRDKKIEEARRKSQDPDLSEDERRKWRNELTVLLAQQDDDKKEKDNIIKTVKQIREQIANNNKNIASIGSSSYSKDKGIWEFITLENILIIVAIYALWQIIRDSNRRY